MRRKTLNESIKIDVVSLSDDYDDISINELRDMLEDAGADVSQEKTADTIYMVVDNLTEDDVVDVLSPVVPDIETYVEYDDYRREPTFESYIPDDDYPEYFDDEDDDDYPEYFDDEDEDDYPEYFDDEDGYYDEEEDDDADWRTYEDSEFAECDGANCKNDDDEFDECEKPLNETITYRRKKCCPPKGRMVNLSEALHSQRRHDISIREIVQSARNQKKKGIKNVSEAVYKRALNKALNESRQIKVLKTLKTKLGASKYNMIIEALRNHRTYLYTNKKINNKRINKYSSKELYKLLTTVNEQINAIKKQLRHVNESKNGKKMKQLKEELEIKKRLFNLLDEELTYRLTYKKMVNEADEDNLLKELPVGPENDDMDADVDENPEDDKVEELSRVVITLDSQEAADELKQDLIDAGVPEDAIEIGDETDEEGEENEDETDEEGEEETEESNESIHYKKFRRLLEADDDDDASDDDEGDDTSDDDEGDDTSDDDSDDDSDDEGDDEDSVKLVLTDTDYIHELADVLDDKYGITKEELEEMIGGEIIEEESDEDEDEESDDEDSDEDSDEDEESSDKKKKDKKDKKEKKSSGDAAIDAMSQEEIDDLFGNN